MFFNFKFSFPFSSFFVSFFMIIFPAEGRSGIFLDKLEGRKVLQVLQSWDGLEVGYTRVEIIAEGHVTG